MVEGWVNGGLSIKLSWFHNIEKVALWVAYSSIFFSLLWPLWCFVTKEMTHTTFHCSLIAYHLKLYSEVVVWFCITIGMNWRSFRKVNLSVYIYLASSMFVEYSIWIKYVKMQCCPVSCTLPQVREGEIGSFQSIKLEVFFTPTIPGEAKLDFHIMFSNLSSKPVRHNTFFFGI